MRTIALIVEYDGTLFHGFQRQTSLPTVQGELESALSALCEHPVSVVAAGRTDAGVHATGQVVSFQTSADVPLARMPLALSGMLRAKRIAVLKAVARADEFSARHDALARSYRYRILNRVAPSPLLERRAFYVRAPLDLERMRAGATALIGEHDFTSFCAELPARGLPVRNIETLELARQGEVIELDITADSFLHQMVRVIAGTLVEVGRGTRDPDGLPAALAAKRRDAAGLTAPAHALYLTHVRYADPL